MCLIGVGKYKSPAEIDQNNENAASFSSFSNEYIQLNPGPNYEIEPNDLCFYISLVKEENYDWKEARNRLSNSYYFFCRFNLKLNKKKLKLIRLL